MGLNNPATSYIIQNQSQPARTSGITYHNNQGVPIYVSIQMNVTLGTAFTLNCDSSSTPTTNLFYAGNPAAGITILHFIVLPGYYYVLNTGNSIAFWTEWY
jgi:hypothetical protein